MINSWLFKIAAHPDLINIFSLTSFHKLLECKDNLFIIEQCIEDLNKNNMAMEISAAGLRKPCKEIYPCKQIMELASKHKVKITFASDGHCVNTIGKNLDILESYASDYGFKSSFYYNNGWNEVFF